LALLGQAIDAGADDHDTWDAIIALTDQRRKLVESEAKRLQTMQQMISAQQAMVLVAALVDVVRRHVTDREVLAVISNEIRALTVVEHG
jgi:hypothetical protein